MEIVKLEEKSSLMPDFYQKHNFLLITELYSCFSKHKFRIKLQKGLSLSDSSQFISFKKNQSSLTGKSLHKADICTPFCQILYQHGDFLIILPIELFHYIIWDFSRHFHNLLGHS